MFQKNILDEPMATETLDRCIQKDLVIAPAQVEEAPENLISNFTPCTTSKKMKRLAVSIC